MFSAEITTDVRDINHDYHTCTSRLHHTIGRVWARSNCHMRHCCNVGMWSQHPTLCYTASAIRCRHHDIPPQSSCTRPEMCLKKHSFDENVAGYREMDSSEP